MRTLTIFVAVVVGPLTLGACDSPYGGGDAPAVDPTAPRVHITSPEFGTFAGDVRTIEVRGTATDDTLVTSVEVNGVAATVHPDGTFTATVPVSVGTNLIHAIAKDAQNNQGKETRAVVAGPTLTIARAIPKAITATVSAQTFDAIGRGASSVIASSDLTSLVSSSNPVIDVGTTNGQPDCLYGQASVTLIDVGSADITLTPQAGGIQLDASLVNVQTNMHLQWSVACLDGSRDVIITSSRIHISGVLGAGVDFFNNIHFSLANPNVDIANFHVELGGVPQRIIDSLDLGNRLGPLLATATEKFVAPKLDQALAHVNETKTVDLLDKKLDITVFPTKVDIDTTGMLIEVETEIRAQGDSGEFVYVPNSQPAMDKSRGFQLAVADDAVNQMLTSFWSAKGLDIPINLKTGPYGEIGQLYDRVELSAKVPPYLDASGSGLKLTIGDLVATFKNGDAIATQVVVNAHLDLNVAADPTTGALRLDVGTPTAFVDIIDENIDGANALSNAQFEAITSFALARIVSFGSGAVGAIPLPAVGGVGLANVAVSEQTGYLVVDGEIH